MTVNYTTLLSLGQPVTGTESGTWGADVNNAVTAYLDIAIAGTLTLTGDGAVTLANTQGTNTATNIGATTAQYYILKIVGPLTATKVITAPSISKSYLVLNTDSTYAVTIKATGQTGVNIAANSRAVVAFNGTDYVVVAAGNISNLSGLGTGVATALGINVGSAGSFLVNGGALGTPSSGTLTNATGLPLSTGVTGTLPIANGGTGATDAATARSNLGAGTVTSVAGTGSVNGITLSGTVTSTGNLTLGGSLSGVNLASQVTGTLPVANGGTGLTATPSNGQIDIGNGSGFTRTTLTAGSNVTITNGPGSITISATGGGGGGGTVTSVGLSFSGGLVSVANSPITSSGTLALSVAGTSGGIPYFSSNNAWASSSALTSGAVVIGGGAGGAPSTVSTSIFSIDTANTRVGIGTASPSVSLNVYRGTDARLIEASAGGTFPTLSVNDRVAFIGNVSGGHSNGVQIISGTSGTAYLGFGDTDAASRGFVNYINSSDAMTFGTAASERMRIDISGNVGIGTSGPAAALHVVGVATQFRAGTANNYFYVAASDSGYATSCFVGGSSAVAAGFGAETSIPINFYIASDIKAQISTSGDFIIGTGAISTSATSRFLWITSCAGAPTGSPTAPYTNAAAMVADTTNSRLYVRIGSTWKYASLT